MPGFGRKENLQVGPNQTDGDQVNRNQDARDQTDGDRMNQNQINWTQVEWDRDIHKFQLHGTRILLDVNSGSVHIIDEAAWQVLEALEQHRGNVEAAWNELKAAPPDALSFEEFGEIIGELRHLQQQKLLFTSDREVAAWVQDSREPIIKSLCLNVTHGCNMRCGYCFASDTAFGVRNELMSYRVGRQAIDFLLEKSGSRRHLEVDFFGGEPLLNLQTIQKLTHYGTQRAQEMGNVIKFTVTTNCVLIDASFIRFVNENKMQVVLSLDGRQRVHDRVRRLIDGSNSYDTILPRMLQLADSRNHENYYVRGTFTNRNMDFSRDVLHLFDLGFKHVSLEPVVAPPETYGFSDADIPALEQEYEKLSMALLERHNQGQFIDFFHFNVDLTGGTCIPKRIKGCGAGFEYLAVAPDGTLFPCHQFDGKADYEMGNVFDGLGDDNISREFASAHIYAKKACKDCWARFFCSGGCHANAVEFSGSLLEPYSVGCRLQKKRLECAVWFQLRQQMPASAASGNSQGV